MGAAAPPLPRNLAAPRTAETERERSVLAILIAAVEPDGADDLAARLIGEFRSLARLGSQNIEAIERVAGRGNRVAPLLIGARAVAEAAMQSKLRGSALHPARAKLLDYLKLSMGSLADENLRVMFLDNARRLIADECMQRGTIGQVALYPRVIFRRALELDASALILVHNHPSGDPTPSCNDVAATDRMVELGQSLGVEICEHIVVTATEHRFILGNSRVRTASMPRPFDLRSQGDPSGKGGDTPADRETAARDHGPASDPVALANALLTQRRRLLRRQLLGADHLFGEPAWDMLIELFIHQLEGKPISMSSLGLASGMSATSGLRLVQNLLDAGLILREVDREDARRTLITLAPGILHRLSLFFGTTAE